MLKTLHLYFHLFFALNEEVYRSTKHYQIAHEFDVTEIWVLFASNKGKLDKRNIVLVSHSSAEIQPNSLFSTKIALKTLLLITPRCNILFKYRNFSKVMAMRLTGIICKIIFQKLRQCKGKIHSRKTARYIWHHSLLWIGLHTDICFPHNATYFLCKK